MSSNEVYVGEQITTSQLIKGGFGTLGGIFCSSASGGPTITIWDSLTGSGTKLVDSFTPVGATPYPFPCGFSTGLYVTISGTASITVFWV